MQSLPLYELLTTLRRYDLPLGVSDYLTALYALRGGVGVRSRQQLIFACQVLWGKSAEEQAVIAQELDKLLPNPLTDEQLQQLLQPETEEYGPEEPISDPGQTQPQVEDESEQSETDHSAGEDEEEANDVNQRLIDFQEGHMVANISLTDEQKHLWQFDVAFDFVGNPPITRRQMKRAWRFYRRMQRFGPRVEIDVEATVRQMHRQGFMAELVLVPRRTNRARALLLVDADDVMIPFRRITRDIIATAQQNALAEAFVVYFQRVPGQTVFLDEDLYQRETLANILPRFTDAGMLIISDGGTARVLREDNRYTALQSSLDRLRRYSQNIAWLNPFPRERWLGTPADLIQSHLHVPMFPFSREGLERAVDVLRGKTS